ncbi:unnamed protein product, partial [Meganyctiphanes norvegica]
DSVQNKTSEKTKEKLCVEEKIKSNKLEKLQTTGGNGDSEKDNKKKEVTDTTTPKVSVLCGVANERIGKAKRKIDCLFGVSTPETKNKTIVNTIDYLEKAKPKSKKIKTLLLESEEYEPSPITPVTTKVPTVEYKPAPITHVLSNSAIDEYEPQPLSQISQKNDSFPEYKPQSTSRSSSVPEYEPQPIKKVQSLWDKTKNVPDSPPAKKFSRWDQLPLSSKSLISEQIKDEEYSPACGLVLDTPLPDYTPSEILRSDPASCLEDDSMDVEKLSTSSFLQSSSDNSSINSSKLEIPPPISFKSASSALEPISSLNLKELSSKPNLKQAPKATSKSKVELGFYREQSSDKKDKDHESNDINENKNKKISDKNSSSNKKNKSRRHGCVSGGSCVLIYTPPPPSFDEILDSMSEYDIPDVVHPSAFCSNPKDIPVKPKEVSGQVVKLKSSRTSDLDEFEGKFQLDGLYNWRLLLNMLTSESEMHSPAFRKPQNKGKVSVLTPLNEPPSRQEVEKWARARTILNDMKKKSDKDDDDEDKDKRKDKDGKGKKERDVNASKKRESKNVQEKCGNSSSQKSYQGPTGVKHSEDFSYLTSTPSANKSMKPTPLHLTPIGNSKASDTSPVFARKKIKRRVSWDTEDGVKSTSHSTSKNRSSMEDFSPLEGDDMPLPPIKRRVSFAGLGVLQEETSTEHVITPKSKNTEIESHVEAEQPLSTGSDKECKQTHDILEDSVSSSEDVINSSQPPVSSCVLELPGKLSRQPSSDSSFRRHLLDSQFRQQFLSPSASPRSCSQMIEGPTMNTTFGFKFSNHNLREAKALHEHEFLTVICVECHVTNRPGLLPDPAFDPISALVFTIIQDVPEDHPTPQKLKGAFVVSAGSSDMVTRTGVTDLSVLHVENEIGLLNEVVNLVATWDPDILIGYEVQMSSWGYLLERGVALGTEIVSRLSRVPEGNSSHHSEEQDEYGSDHASHIHITGRIVLNVWRLMRAEVALQSYTLQSVTFNLLHTRIAVFSHDKLRQWWTQDNTRWRTLEYYITRCDLTIDLMHRLDLITRTAELGRLFGIRFYDVFSRGTQYRVESMMLRLARGANMVAISPSVQQRANSKAPEWIALNMEPESRFYTDPVVVLDFQSLYPSMMIAYNYCFSTCLGRVQHLGSEQPFEFGASHLKVPPRDLAKIVEKVNVSPCGVAYVQSSVRRGILPQMLEEILNTRIMVKQAMKKYKNNSSLQKVLHSRQLGLKLIANVTYGYTSANFSGRMPCIEVGDSVVSKGRETLERLIKMIHNTKSWNAQVVYGDTDSVFVHLPGRSKDDAFKIGYEIADKCTKINPKPVKLKFEKVYLPCILQTKKRYVGYMYETPDQKMPVFEAKGIETVRRDGCPAVSKILEKALRILFDKCDVSEVKSYVQRQFVKLLQGRASIQDLIFAKEYRGARGYRPGACVPALTLARQWSRIDPRREPRAGERVPYVVVYGAPGLPLIQLVRSPEVVLGDPALRLNSIYYITRAIIPALERCFSLLGFNVLQWYSELSRGVSTAGITSGMSSGGLMRGHGSASIAQYFTPVACVTCGNITQTAPGATPLCAVCRSDSQRTVLALSEKLRTYDRALDHINKVCRGCLGYNIQEVDCISLDCPILYRRIQAKRDLEQVEKTFTVVESFTMHHHT